MLLNESALLRQMAAIRARDAALRETARQHTSSHRSGTEAGGGRPPLRTAESAAAGCAVAAVAMCDHAANASAAPKDAVRDASAGSARCSRCLG